MFENLKKNKKAMSGISTLIIFIAMILVAAVAAMVLLQTVSSLQSQALSTGKESKQQVSTKLEIISIIGQVNTGTYLSLENMRMTAELAPGSNKINLDQMLIGVSGASLFKSGIKYNASATDSDSDMLTAIANTDNYSVKWLTTAPTGRSAISAGDKIEMWYNTNDVVGVNEDVSVELIPSGGAGTRIYLKTPVSFDKEFIKIYP